MGEMAEIPRGTPLRDAWEEYRATDSYANTRSWALKEPSVDGSLWAAFNRGWEVSAKATRANNEASGIVWFFAIVGVMLLAAYALDWAVFFVKFSMGWP